MSILLFFSKTDKFSDNVFNNLVNECAKVFIESNYDVYKYIDTYLVYVRDRDLPFIDEEIINKTCSKLNIDFKELKIVFISRHEMKNPRPLLTVHTSGNWSKAEYGGIDEEISICNACLNSNIARMLNKLANEYSITDKYSVSIEATHHGPSINYESCFIEVGSSENEWNDIKCIKLFRDLIDDLINSSEKYVKKRNKIVVSIGDLHYCTLTNHVINNEYDIGHIIPKYITQISEKNIRDLITKTIPKPETLIIHWKSLKKDTRDFIIKILQEWYRDIEIIKRK